MQKFNHDQYVFKSTRMSFSGCICMDNRVYPDSKKVGEIMWVPSPGTKLNLLRCLEMANLLSNHLPNLSVSSSNLRDLTKNNYLEY